jgi:DNA-binding NarL/FixJ family response regulator
MHEPDPGPVAPLRVLVVDADDRTRESLTGILGIGRDVVVVGSAGQPASALDLVATESPDVVVVDPRLPEMDGGLAFLARLRADAPGVRILVMGGGEGIDQPALARRSDGFIRKTFRPGELAAAIVAAGRPA